MFAKAILVLCAQALLAHVAFSQCVYPKPDCKGALYAPSIGAASCGALGGNGLNYGAGLGYRAGQDIGCGHGYVAPGLSAAREISTRGGAFPVFSFSAIAPTGIFIVSENTFEGPLYVAAELPFLSAVALNAVLPTAGTGVVNYGCGNGITAITTDAGYSADAYGLGAAGIGYGPGLEAIAPAAVGVAEHGCGCGVY